MMAFSNFLLEARFAEDTLDRLFAVVERRMPSLLGHTIHRYGGPTHVERSGSERRVTWIFSDRAFGIRFTHNEIEGIDVWTKYNINAMPSHFIRISDVSASTLIGAIREIAKFIKRPIVGVHHIDDTLSEGLLTEMAKRVSDEGFYKLAVDKYGDKASSLSWEEIKSLADEHDVLIPGYIRQNKVGRGRWDARVGEPAPASQVSVPAADDMPIKTGSNGEPILYLKITAQDPKTKRFLPTAELKQAQDLYQQINDKVLTAPPTKEEMRDVNRLFGHLYQLSSLACQSKLTSLIIYGGPGSGKTHSIMQAFKDNGLVAGRDYAKISGRTTPQAIYQTLFMFRKGGLVLFDDCDSMWGNQDATNVLKAALDTSPVREISWGSSQLINVTKMSAEDRDALFARIDDQIAENPEKVKLPNQFEFTGRVIFISNLSRDEFDTAILSRSAKIDMTLTGDEILARMRAILPSLGGTDVAVEKKEELIDALMSLHARKEIEAVTMREFIKGMNILRSGAENWRELLQFM